MLKRYLSEPAWRALQEAKARQLIARAASGVTELLDERVARVYGDWDTYRAAVSVLPPDQVRNYERAGIILQPKQVEFAKAAREADESDTPDQIGVGGARGGGKSFSVFASVGVDDCQRFPGLKVLYLRRTAKAGQEQMQDLVQSALGHVDCVPKITRVDYPNGSRIVIGGYKDDREAMKYQGIEYDVLVIEELTQLTERTYKTLRLSSRSSKGWRPRVYTTFNPLGIGHQWVKRTFIDPHRRGERGRTTFIPSLVSDNAFNNPEYVLNLDDLTGAEKHAYRWGDWDVASGAYFETWDYNTHVIAPLEKILPHWRKWGAMDAGFQHWNMVYFFAENGDGDTIIFHELAHRKHHADTIAPDIHATLASYGLTVADLRPFVVGTDAFHLAAGQQETLAQQYKKHGISLSAADMSPGSRIAGWQLLSRSLGDPRGGKKPTLYITRNCARLIETLPYAERDPNNAEDVKKWNTDEDGQGGDDPLDAARYGLKAGMKRGQAVVESERYA